MTMVDREPLDLSHFLSERRDVYDLTWISRTHNASRLAPIFKK
jgi:hypothetical protein